MRRALAFASSAALLGSALPAIAWAEAQEGAGGDQGALAGIWFFQAEPFFAFGVTQEISGEMELIANGDGTYRCTFEAQDRIPEEDVTIRTEQTCTATREGDEVTIVSGVVSVDPPEYNYVPDDFTLTVRAACHMAGVMHTSEGDTVAAEFRCGDALVS